MKPIKLIYALFIGGALELSVQAQGQAGILPKVDELAQTYVKQPRNMALEVGLLVNGKTYFTGFGKLSKEQIQPPDEYTAFELGALSGVFTTTLLAILEDRQQILPDATVGQLLPKGFESPVFNSERLIAVTPPAEAGAPPERIVTCLPDPIAGTREIAVCQLAYHASGLTCSCSDLYRWHPLAQVDLQKDPPRDVDSAEAFFREAALFKFNHPPGEKWTFSNIGIAYLGHLLSASAGIPFEALLEREVFRPLGLKNTRIKWKANASHLRAPGHDAKGKPAPSWELVGMAPAAGLKSSAYDLMQLIQAQLQLIPGITQGAALQAQQGMIEARFPGWKRPTLAAYGWLISTDEENRAITWMNGGTGGYRAFAGYDANRKIGVVLLSNSQGDLTELGFAIFRQLLDL